MRKLVLGLFIMAGAITLAACAVHPQNGDKTAKTRKVCSSHTKIGSHIANIQCQEMTESQYQAYRKAKQARQKKEHDEYARKHAGDLPNQGGPE